MSESKMDDKTLGEKLCEALKKFMSTEVVDQRENVYVQRVLSNHPTSLKAYMRIVSSFIESSREREYNITEANEEDGIPVDSTDAWEFLSNNPVLAEKYIKSIPDSEYVFFSQEILLK